MSALIRSGFVIVATVSLAFASLAQQAKAQDYWEYKDWRVWVEDVDTGEDLRRTCTAWTGGDGYPTLNFEVTNADAGPPSFYPYPTLSETAPRHYPTLIQNEQTVDFITDRGVRFSSTANARLNEDGLFEAHVAFNLGNNLLILQAMKQGREVDVQLAGRSIYTVSLTGFTAAYGKMMDRCGFSLSLD